MTKRFREIIFVAASVLTIWSALAISSPASSQASDTVHLETFKTHSRLSFRVDEGVSAEWKATREGFELFLKGIGYSDLGAPLGEEAQWQAQFKELRDPRLSELQFAEVMGGVRVRGTWKYPVGAQAPADPLMESFDYREKTSSELVVDFWVKESPTVAQLQTRGAVNRQLASVKKQKEELASRAARKAAREKARERAEDVSLFCREPLTEKNDVFLQLNPVSEKVNFSRWFAITAPDAGFPYYEPKGKSRDAQYVRLALELYRQGKHALVNRTLDFFDQEHPTSPFRTEMRFLRSNALLKMDMTEEGYKQLSELLFEAKGTPAGLHAAMFLVRQQLEKQNHLGALESFLWLTKNYSSNRLAWVFHLGAAECARKLKQTERAAKEYQWIAENAPDAAASSEGALRMGDLYMLRFQFDQALAAYSQGMRHFKAEADSFPSLHINRAEALYGLEEYDRAALAYKEFLARFPGNSAGWRATFRLGEIEARKPNASRESEKARHWFLETINRYPFTPGATLARLRLVACGDHAGLNSESAQRFFTNEVEPFDGAGEIAMERYPDFRALAHVRAMMTLGNPDAAVTIAIEELKRVPRKETRSILNNVLAFNFRKSILALLNKGEKLQALSFYEKRSDSLPIGDGTVDPDYILKLSQAASDLNLGKLGQSLNAEFQKAQKQFAASQSLPSGRTIASDGAVAVAQAEDMDDPEVRMQVSERGFTQAKALWMGSGISEEETIRAALAKVDSASRFSYEREIILGLMEEKHGRPLGALRHAVRAQLLGSRDSRVEAWVASLQQRAGDVKASLETYRRLEGALPSAGTSEATSVSAASLLGVPAAPGRDAILITQSEILEKMNHWGEAAALYARGVEKGVGGNKILYGYARALLKTGSKANRDKAIAALEKLAGQDEASVAGAAAVARAPAGAIVPGAPASAGGAAKKEVAQLSDAQQEQEKFWRKLASETLANVKAAGKSGQ